MNYGVHYGDKMKACLLANEYDLIESALIQFGRSDLAQADKEALSVILKKLRTTHALSPSGKICLEPMR